MTELIIKTPQELMDCLGMICVPEEAPAFYICRENHFL